MTDKEKIIIDGVEVSGCIYLPYCEDKQGNCGNNPNCYYKQLKRKEQEYEELEELLKLRTDDRINKLERAIIRRNVKIECYRKALEEIKDYTRKQFCDNCEDISSTEYTCHCEYCEYQEYFEIIEKAKDGE